MMCKTMYRTKITPILFVSLLFLLVPFSLLLAQETQPVLPRSWQQLSSAELSADFLFSSGQSREERYIPFPSTFVRKSMPLTRKYAFQVADLNKTLEQSGIDEEISIHLIDSRHGLDLPLGTFKPSSISSSGGKPDWNVPRYIECNLPWKAIRHIIITKVKANRNLNTSEPGQLVFKNKTGTLETAAKCKYFLPFKYEKKAFRKLDALLIKEEYDKAFKYSRRREGKLKDLCLAGYTETMLRGQLWVYMLEDRHTLTRETAQAEADELGPYILLVAGEICMELEKFQLAADYFIRSGLEFAAKRTGDAYFRAGQMEKAIRYYEQAEPSVQLAHAYAKLADNILESGNPAITPQNKSRAKSLYKKAIAAFETMIKQDRYQWKDQDNHARLQCRLKLYKLGKSPQEKEAEKELAGILKKADAYCKRLDNAMIRFFCKEDISEQANFKGHTRRNRLVYEYQLIQEKNTITERRILLRKNKIKMRREDSPLETISYKYEKLIFGPIGFLHKGWQNHFQYNLLGEDTIDGERAIVLEVLPLRWSNVNLRGGKIWLSPKNMAVLKIEFLPKYLIRNFHRALEFAIWNDAQLHIDFVCEFKVEKNGIRFPSKYLIAEHIIYPGGEKKLRNKIEVTFKDFMFFIVGSEVISSEAEY